MIAAPNLVLLGSAGRNVGKTELACQLIRRHAPVHDVYAVKITTVQRRDGACPRGGSGCGVCSSLQEPFCITEETEVGTGKDTARMREAGATKVLWLRVEHAHLAEGVAALWSRIPRGACIVCESNSARLVLEPGAFVIIRAATEVAPKATCASVLHEADRVLEYQDGHWDQNTEGWRFEAGTWAVPAAATAAVLAGGQSRRMGQDKRFLPVGGRTLLEHIVAQLLPVVDEVLIGANDEIGPPAMGARIVADDVPGLGPLGGIGACLAAARHDRVFVTACDIPTLPSAFVRMMLRRGREADIAIPVSEDGRYEPMLAVYSRRVLPALRSILAGGGRRVTELLTAPGVRVVSLPLPREDWYRNLNSPADYGRFLST